jgi:hypothetical protein
MTTTKIIYLAAAILPFGFVVLAAALLLRTYLAHRKENAAALASVTSR